jgi:hypothetical protein
MEVEQLEPRHVKDMLTAKAAEKPVRGISLGPEKSSDDVDLTNIEKVHRFPYGLRR